MTHSLFIMVVAVSTLAQTCGGIDCSSENDTGRIEVTLINATNRAALSEQISVNFLADGESSNSDTLLAPGESRTVYINVDAEERSYPNFFAQSASTLEIIATGACEHYPPESLTDNSQHIVEFIAGNPSVPWLLICYEWDDR